VHVYHDFRSLSPGRQAELVHRRDAYQAFLRRLIEDGQRSGSVRAELDPKIAAIALLSTLNSIHLWYRPDAGRSPEEIARLYADFLLGGLQCGVPDVVDLAAAERNAVVDLRTGEG
jgi:hypothetical protein